MIFRWGPSKGICDRTAVLITNVKLSGFIIDLLGECKLTLFHKDGTGASRASDCDEALFS